VVFQGEIVQNYRKLGMVLAGEKFENNETSPSDRNFEN